MPYLSVALGAPESEQTTARIAALPTDLTAEVLKKKRELTAVTVEYVRAERWFIGGTSLAERGTASFHLDIKVTEGTNTKDEKAAFVQRVFAGLEAAVGQLEPASYVVIHEVRADAWGYGGATQEYRYVEGKRLWRSGPGASPDRPGTVSASAQGAIRPSTRASLADCRTG